MESCDPNNNYTMCPLCNGRCGYWDYDQICMHVKATHTFDNAATVFFAVFMSLWGLSNWSNDFTWCKADQPTFDILLIWMLWRSVLIQKFCVYYTFKLLSYFIFRYRFVLTKIMMLLFDFLGTFYLEFWKREQAGIQSLWDLRNFEEEEVCVTVLFYPCRSLYKEHYRNLFCYCVLKIALGSC